MRLAVLFFLIVVAPVCRAGAHCEFGALFRFVAIEKRAIDDEGLRAIGNSPHPINPMTHDESLGRLQRHAFESAFAKHLEAGVAPEKWAEVRRDALRILARRHGEADARAGVISDTEWLTTPRTILKRAPVRGGSSMQPHAPVIAVLNDGKVTFGPLLYSFGPFHSLSLETGAWEGLPSYPDNLNVFALRRAPDGKTVSIAVDQSYGGSTLVVSDATNGIELARGSTGRAIAHVPKVAFYREDGALVIQTLPNGSEAPAQYDSQLGTWSASRLPIFDAQVSPDGKKAFGATLEPRGIPWLTTRKLKFALADLKTGKKVFERDLDIPATELPKTNARKAAAMAFKEGSDGTTHVAFRLRNKVFIFDSAHESVTTLDLPPGDYEHLALEIGKEGRVFFLADRTTPDGSTELAMAEAKSKFVQRFDLPKGSRGIFTHSTPDGRVRRLYESATGLWMSEVFGPPK